EAGIRYYKLEFRRVLFRSPRTWPSSSPSAACSAPGAGRDPMIDIQQAIETLRTGEESVRRRVVDDLGRSGRAEAIAPLLMAVAEIGRASCRERATDAGPAA